MYRGTGPFLVLSSLLYALFALLPMTSAKHHHDEHYLELCQHYTLPPPPRPEPLLKHPSPILKITGDHLNVTRCYCRSQYSNPEDFGFILQADYWNYHHDTKYQALWRCQNATLAGGIPQCWDTEWRRDQWLECDVRRQSGKFCYKMGFKKGDHEHHGPIASDTYTFDSQKHRLIFGGQERKLKAFHPSSRPAPEECATMCYHWLPNFTPLFGPEAGWNGTVALDTGDPNQPQLPICSRKEVYTDLDDMCEDCE
ncbi:hypothetical protein ACLMJK_004293 [Lecanora helva]